MQRENTMVRWTRLLMPVVIAAAACAAATSAAAATDISTPTITAPLGGVGDGTGTLSYTQYRISPHWQRGKSLSTLEAANLNGDGVPDLWAVTPDGIARAYLVSHLSATGPARIEPQKPQKLT